MTVQPYTLKSEAQVYVIIVVVVLRFFEYVYIFEVLGLWGSGDCMEELMT